MANIGDEG